MFSVFIWPILFFAFTLTSEDTQGSNHQDTYSTLHSVRQHVFIKHEFHYLNVSRVGTFTVYDVFECTFKCLSNPFCSSVNLAASKGDNGEHWCELLSSDKYRNFTAYSGNQTSHHFSKKSPCSSSPCQNGGTCVPNYKRDTFQCLCRNGIAGEDREKIVPDSCKKAYEECKSSSSQLVTLRVDSKLTSVLCHFGDFGCGDGGWTTVMKIDGNKTTFHYNSTYWSDKSEYNLPGGETGFDTKETKLQTFWNTSFTKICLGLKIGHQINFIVINKQANSLYSLIADGQYRTTSPGGNTWKTLIGSQASLQSYCKKEGFNAACSDHGSSRARIGVLGNNEKDCITCDSWIGFGTAGYTNDSNTCGNNASHEPDNGDKNIRAMGYILVQ